MTEKFENDSNECEFDRRFYSLAITYIKHYKAKELCRTSNGIKQYHCFVLTNSQQIYCWNISCHCGHCIAYSWDF